MEPSDFLQTMLRDSRQLESRSEHGQAFDKLARGIEAVMRGRAPRDDSSQRDKAKVVVAAAFADDSVWRMAAKCSSRVASFIEEFTSYAAAQEREACASLQRTARALVGATDSGDRSAGATALAELFLTMRNKRFHGHPAFSGRNFRVARYAPALLEVLRAVLASHAGAEITIEGSERGAEQPAAPDERALGSKPPPRR